MNLVSREYCTIKCTAESFWCPVVAKYLEDMQIIATEAITDGFHGGGRADEAEAGEEPEGTL